MTSATPSATPAQHLRPPSVDRLATMLFADRELSPLGRAALVQIARHAVRENPTDAWTVAHRVATQRITALLQGVVNATGVLLHTNLGRAPLPSLEPTASGPVRYSNLEFDLDTGIRGSRRSRLEPLMASLCGAEAVLVVNNCAAALVLVLAALAQGRSVVVSRGELVEIGGGFRIPDVLEQSGAHLLAVGTTNRTRLPDYESASADHGDVAMLLKVHTSNYRISGFTEDVGIDALSGLGRRMGVPVVADLGSGLLDARTPWLQSPSGSTPPLPWLADEPAVRQSLEAGADLVVFSCDKLMGGPQGGVIAGSKDLVERCARHPLARALRPGGLVVTALQQTLLAYAQRDLDRLPFWKMATQSVAALKERADAIVADVADTACTAHVCASVPGGGTLPGATISSYGVSLAGARCASLRRFSPPVIARSADGATIIDLRTVDPADDSVLVAAIRESLARGTDMSSANFVNDASEH